MHTKMSHQNIMHPGLITLSRISQNLISPPLQELEISCKQKNTFLPQDIKKASKKQAHMISTVNKIHYSITATTLWHICKLLHGQIICYPVWHPKTRKKNIIGPNNSNIKTSNLWLQFDLAGKTRRTNIPKCIRRKTGDLDQNRCPRMSWPACSGNQEQN